MFQMMNNQTRIDVKTKQPSRINQIMDVPSTSKKEWKIKWRTQKIFEYMMDI